MDANFRNQRPTHPLQVAAMRVRETLIARALRAQAKNHLPLSQEEADNQLEGHVRDFKIDKDRLDQPTVGRFYATLLEDDLLLDMFESKVLAEFAPTEIFPFEEMRKNVEAKVEGKLTAEKVNDFLRQQ